MHAVMATCADDRYPLSNVLTPETNQFWMTTGLYPHEIVVHLQNPQPVRTVRFVSTNVRKIQVEVCETPHIGNFTKVGESEIGSLSGGLQREFIEANSGRPVSYVKVVIVSGWDDFVSIHNIKIE